MGRLAREDKPTIKIACLYDMSEMYRQQAQYLRCFNHLKIGKFGFP
jgi:hypothetical protein